MPEKFFEKWLHRVRGAWDVLVGRAWAGYGNPMHYDFNDKYPDREPHSR
jgi:hypothetical protein